MLIYSPFLFFNKYGLYVIFVLIYCCITDDFSDTIYYKTSHYYIYIFHINIIMIFIIHIIADIIVHYLYQTKIIITLPFLYFQDLEKYLWN